MTRLSFGAPSIDGNEGSGDLPVFKKQDVEGTAGGAGIHPLKKNVMGAQSLAQGFWGRAEVPAATHQQNANPVRRRRYFLQGIERDVLRCIDAPWYGPIRKHNLGAKKGLPADAKLPLAVPFD